MDTNLKVRLDYIIRPCLKKNSLNRTKEITQQIGIMLHENLSSYSQTHVKSLEWSGHTGRQEDWH